MPDLPSKDQLTAASERGTSLEEMSDQCASVGDWSGALDAARRANVALFQAGVSGSDALVVQNYLRASRALFQMKEWHESSILANLSLKGLDGRTDKPSRAGAFLLLAKALGRHRDLTGARSALLELEELLTDGERAHEDWAEAGKLARSLGLEWS